MKNEGFIEIEGRREDRSSSTLGPQLMTWRKYTEKKKFRDPKTGKRKQIGNVFVDDAVEIREAFRELRKKADAEATLYMELVKSGSILTEDDAHFHMTYRMPATREYNEKLRQQDEDFERSLIDFDPEKATRARMVRKLKRKVLCDAYMALHRKEQMWDEAKFIASFLEEGDSLFGGLRKRKNTKAVVTKPKKAKPILKAGAKKASPQDRAQDARARKSRAKVYRAVKKLFGK